MKQVYLVAYFKNGELEIETFKKDFNEATWSAAWNTKISNGTFYFVIPADYQDVKEASIYNELNPETIEELSAFITEKIN